MAKGQKFKEEITKKILEVFPNVIINGKEIRICGQEDGIEVQIKVGLTCAKENIDREGNAETITNNSELAFGDETPRAETNRTTEITDEERDNLKRLLESLGM